MQYEDSDRYRNALMWAIDRLGVNKMTDKERADTVRELGNVLLGRSSRAAVYVPNDWDDSVNYCNRMCDPNDGMRCKRSTTDA